MYIFDRGFLQIILFFILAELVSLVAFLEPHIMPFVFWEIVLVVFLVALINLRIAIYILLAELFIGSQGHLFFVSVDGFIFTIRMALWTIVMTVWFGKTIYHFIKNKPIDNNKKSAGKFFLLSQNIMPSGQFTKYFLLLAFFIILAFFNGLVKQNNFGNIFFDINGWLYFFLFIPFSLVLKNFSEIKKAIKILLAAAFWLSIKTYLLLFIFSHNLRSVSSFIYLWVRKTGVGEITLIKNGFYRIFFQSHIFVLVAFLFFIVMFTYHLTGKGAINRRYLFVRFFCMALFLSVIILSLSRSNWVGLLVSLGLFVYFFVKYFDYNRLLTLIGSLLAVFIVSLLMGIIAVKFPYPHPQESFSATALLAERAGQITDEAGVSSRWNLLPKLIDKIKIHPIIGSGFGATVTYKSNDPRVLQSHPGGIYTTYAFEWGWLDFWLKLGFLGMLCYALLLTKVFFVGLKNIKKNINTEYSIALILGLAAIATIHFFSPYLNHPLGIGYLLLTVRYFDLNAIIEKEKGGLPIS